MSSRGNPFSRALARVTGAGRNAGGVGEVHGEREARAWEKELRAGAGKDARYTKAGLAYAARAQVDQPALSAQAARHGNALHTEEYFARLNMASIASIPATQVSARTRSGLMASAARGEDTYAYPPISTQGPQNTPWNMWYRGTRANIPAFEQQTGGVVESNNQRRIG